MENFGTTSVTQGQIENHSITVGCLLNGLLQSLLDLRRKIFDPADGAEPDVILNHFFPLLRQVFLEQAHQGGDFLLGPLPVFDGEGVEREDLDSKFSAGLGDLPDGIGPLGVALDPVQGFFLCPSAVPIHNDRNMVGHFLLIDLFHCMGGLFTNETEWHTLVESR